MAHNKQQSRRPPYRGQCFISSPMFSRPRTPHVSWTWTQFGPPNLLPPAPRIIWSSQCHLFFGGKWQFQGPTFVPWNSEQDATYFVSSGLSISTLRCHVVTGVLAPLVSFSKFLSFLAKANLNRFLNSHIEMSWSHWCTRALKFLFFWPKLTLPVLHLPAYLVRLSQSALS